MQRWWLTLGLVALTIGNGCQLIPPRPPTSPVAFASPPSLANLIEAVNANTDRVQSYHSPNAQIGAPGLPSLRATIALEKPRRFRLQAELFGRPKVDLGSNPEMFWFWIAQNEPPSLFYCRHDQYASSQASALLPVRPEWLIEALGLVRFDPAHRHEGPLLDGKGRLVIQSVLPTERGVLLKKTVIDGRRPLVLEQHLYTAQQQLIASARASGHRYDPVQQVSLPTRVEVSLPQVQPSLRIETGDFQLNRLSGDPQQLWLKPVYPGVQEVDLGQWPASQPPQAGASMQRLPAVAHPTQLNAPTRFKASSRPLRPAAFY